jgi:uncharacterized protein YvpB
MVEFRQLMKHSLSVVLIIVLVISSGIISLMIYMKLTEESAAPPYTSYGVKEKVFNVPDSIQSSKPTEAPAVKVRMTSAMLSAPMISQLPELTNGCEITALTMMIQYYGLKQNKLDLLPDMKYDNTPVKTDSNNKIIYWGNPNLGFVGDVTGNNIGFGIYHTPLMELLKKYIPTAIDLTGKSFESLEDKIAEGIPVEVWSTINYEESVNWIDWDTSIGPVHVTLSEHAVLLVGYDKDNVYVNDTLSGLSQVKINKALFIRTWEIMGKQAITYTKGAN